MLGIFDPLGLEMDNSLLLDEKTKCTSIAFDVNNKGLLSRKEGTDSDYIKDCSTIDLTNNNIVSFDLNNCFNDLINLKNINLFNNNIVSISFQSFGNIFYNRGKNMKTINLNNNKINTLKSDSFSLGEFHNLSQLLLGSNNITKLENNVFSSFVTDRMLVNISNNNLNCCDDNGSEMAFLIEKNQTIDCLIFDGNDEKGQVHEYSSSNYNSLVNECFVANSFSPDPGSDAGVIAGSVIAVFVVIMGVGGTWYYFVYRRKGKDLLQGKSAMQFVNGNDNEYESNKDATSAGLYAEPGNKKVYDKNQDDGEFYNYVDSKITSYDDNEGDYIDDR
eukprot:Pgem_evm1s19230